MSLTALAIQAANFEHNEIARLLDQTYRAAHSAKLILDSLKRDLITAEYSDERVASERKALQLRRAKELETHTNSMKQLDYLFSRLDASPEQAREQIRTARITAVESVKLFQAVQTVAQLNSVGSAMAANPEEFSELLESETTTP